MLLEAGRHRCVHDVLIDMLLQWGWQSAHHLCDITKGEVDLWRGLLACLFLPQTTEFETLKRECAAITDSARSGNARAVIFPGVSGLYSYVTSVLTCRSRCRMVART